MKNISSIKNLENDSNLVHTIFKFLPGTNMLTEILLGFKLDFSVKS